MAEKYGIAFDHTMSRIIECVSYEEAVRMVAGTRTIIVYYAHGQWWF